MSDKKMDLHMHSLCSDGADRPCEVVQRAAEAGLSLIALTDHDCTMGVAQAVAEGRKQNIRVLPAVEMDTESPGELHILGVDIDLADPRFVALLETARQRRIVRNETILERLKAAGYDLTACLTRSIGSTTRLHIALALVDAGYAKDLRDAFGRYLRRGCVGYCTVPRFSPEEVVSAILGAGGVPVWAHPFHGGQNVHRMLDMLKSAGLRGLEAYHPSATEGEAETLLSLAKQNGLLVTCGSDSHGANRPGVTLGCTWRDTPELAAAYEFFMGRPER